MSFSLPRRRILIVAMLAIGVASGVYAYAATNTVPNSTAGAGSGTISGYTVTNVAYTLNTTTPTNLDQVAFTIAPTTAATLKVQLAAAGAWYTCANETAACACNTTSPQATAAAATRLTVVAARCDAMSGSDVAGSRGAAHAAPPARRALRSAEGCDRRWVWV